MLVGQQKELLDVDTHTFYYIHLIMPLLSTHNALHQKVYKKARISLKKE